MTFSIDGYTVDIKAKFGKSADKRMNKRDAMAIMNLICIWAGEAANQFDSTGCPALARQARKANDDIYNLLDANGLYDNL